MQTLREFRLQLAENGRVIGEPWLRVLCRRGLMPGAQYVANRVWMLPDDAALPALKKTGRKPWKNVPDHLPDAGQAAEDAARMKAFPASATDVIEKPSIPLPVED